MQNEKEFKMINANEYKPMTLVSKDEWAIKNQFA